MSQTSYIIGADLSGLDFRTRANEIYDAILTQNSGAIAPTETKVGMVWLDTANASTHYLKVRNDDDTAWKTTWEYKVSTQEWSVYDISSLSNFRIASGSANVITLAIPKIKTYEDNLMVFFQATIDSTSAMTVNINGIGASPIVVSNTALEGGEVVAGGFYALTRSAANLNFELKDLNKQTASTSISTTASSVVLSGTIGLLKSKDFEDTTTTTSVYAVGNYIFDTDQNLLYECILINTVGILLTNATYFTAVTVNQLDYLSTDIVFTNGLNLDSTFILTSKSDQSGTVDFTGQPDNLETWVGIKLSDGTHVFRTTRPIFDTATGYYSGEVEAIGFFGQPYISSNGVPQDLRDDIEPLAVNVMDSLEVPGSVKADMFVGHQIDTGGVAFQGTDLTYFRNPWGVITDVVKINGSTFDIILDIDNNEYEISLSYPEQSGGFGILCAIAISDTTKIRIQFRNADSKGSSQDVGAGRISVTISGGKI